MNKYDDMLVSGLDVILEERGLSTSGLKTIKVKRLEKYDLEMSLTGKVPEVKNVYVKSIKQEKPYNILMWSGVKEVYACTKCKFQTDDKDDAILHYLSHFPENERNSVLDRVVKDI
jgi:hypothetical protein